MATSQAMSIEVSTCVACNLPSIQGGRSLCASCLNRNLQRACEKTIVLSPGAPRIGPGAPRAFFPGMPRAVLGPVIKEKGYHIPAPHCRVLVAGYNAAPSSQVRASNCKPDADVSSCLDSNKDGQSQAAAERTDQNGAEIRTAASGEQEKRSNLAMEEGNGAKVGVEKWHLFQIRKNLTVRIPNPPSDVAVRPYHPQPLVLPSKKHSYYSVPAHKEACPRNSLRPSKLKKWTIRPDPSAEAELMMRLLADSIPILKSTAPLVLPHCEVRPAPISPLSPPGDPLWKRRCIPCPKSLKLQVASICVR